MAIAVSYVGAGGYASVGTTTKTWNIPTLTTGVGVAVLVYWGHASNSATWSSPQLSVDGAAQSSSNVAGSGDKVVQWHFFPNVATAEQDFVITNSGSTVNADCFVFQITGHDTSDMFGNEGTSSSSTTCGITMSAAGNAALLFFATAVNATISGGGGSWSALNQRVDAPDFGKVEGNVGINSGAVTISSTNSQALMQAIEIKAASGGPVTVAASGSALTTGHGTQVPGIQIGI